MKLSKKKFLVVLFMLFFVSTCFADINANYPKDLWKGVIGEAVSEGYDGMYAVACVYRNRLKQNISLGCVAMKRTDLDKFISMQGEKYEVAAKKIIKKVFIENGPDITYGATHYENVEKFGLPYWAVKMEVTAKIGSHTFFKEKKY